MANTKTIGSPSTQNDKCGEDTTIAHSANKSWLEMVEDKERSLYDDSIIGTAESMHASHNNPDDLADSAMDVIEAPSTPPLEMRICGMVISMLSHCLEEMRISKMISG